MTNNPQITLFTNRPYSNELSPPPPGIIDTPTGPIYDPDNRLQQDYQNLPYPPTPPNVQPSNLAYQNLNNIRNRQINQNSQQNFNNSLIGQLPNFRIYPLSLNSVFPNQANQTQHSTIQNAIDASINGDIIYIPSGVYTENLIINKSITLIGEDVNNTIIKSSSSATTPTIQITDGASGSLLYNFTVQGKYSSQSNTGSGDSNNNTSGILIRNTDTNNKPEINNLIFSLLKITNASNGIAFNNFKSNNISIEYCYIFNNEGSGIRIASNTEVMRVFEINSSNISNNNLNAITSNPSGSYRPNCTDFKINNCTIENNNRLTLNNSHDISIFGFNGNLIINNCNIKSNHFERKQVNGTSTSPTSGGWGLAIYGRRDTDLKVYNLGNLSLTNLTFTGNVIKSCLGIERYNSFGNITFDNVDLKSYDANKANQTWTQLSIGHNDINKQFNIGNTKLKTIFVSQAGDVYAKLALFYNNTSNILLDINDTNDQTIISNQVIDKSDNIPSTNLGNLIFYDNIIDNIFEISPTTFPNSIQNTINNINNTSNFVNNIITFLSGNYVANTLQTTNKLITLQANNGFVTLKQSS